MATIAAPRASGSGRQSAAVEQERTAVLEARIRRTEEAAAWALARSHADRIHLAVVADRPDIADHSAGAIVVLADRRLRQIGGSDAA